MPASAQSAVIHQCAIVGAERGSVDPVSGNLHATGSPGAAGLRSQVTSRPDVYHRLPLQLPQQQESRRGGIVMDSVWVFGYGSLCWSPGFEYNTSRIGYIKGFARRFWQGNTTHRGVANNPGRVATLVEQENAVTYGVAFQLKDESALEYLDGREVTLGGYKTLSVDFYDRGDVVSSTRTMLFIATPSSKHWLGPAPLKSIASQVLHSRGPAGHNVEYLLRLAEFLRDQVPEGLDDHLKQLEGLVLRGVSENGMCLRTLMGDRVEVERRTSDSDFEMPASARRQSFQYTSTIPTKSLRCLKL